MKGWQHTHPELFVKRIRKLTGPDNNMTQSFDFEQALEDLIPFLIQ